MAAQYDPNFTSGLEYALSVAGGQNVPNMIAPGVSYSSEFPMGYTANGLAPQPMPAPMPATLEDFQRVDPFAALNAQLSDSLANPTSAMYSTDVGTGASMGLGAPMPINNIGADLLSIMGGFGSFSPTNIVSPESTMFGSFGSGAIPTDFDPTTGELGYRAQNMQDIVNTGQFIGTPDQATAVAGMAAAELNQRVADGDASAIAALASEVSKAKAAQGAADNAADTAGMARDKASAMNTLYGGAGSSFESGRNEYTESGQYDIDKAARDAEFDAMREQQRIDAGLPYKRLTPEETQQAVQKLQASIGFGGAMTPRGRNRIPAMAAEPVREPVPQPVKGYAPFDFANIQSILNNLG